jgi:hypothetical protein
MAGLFGCFAVRAAAGGRVSVPPDGAGRGAALLGLGEGLAGAEIVLCVPDGNRHAGFFLAADMGVIGLAGDDRFASCLPVRLAWGEAGGPVRVAHALRRRVWLGTTEDGALGFGPSSRSRHEDFWLDPLDPAVVAAPVLACASEIAAAMTAPPEWRGVLARVRDGALRRSLAEAVLCSLPADQLEDLARHLLGAPGDVLLLQSALPDDLWLNTRLPALIRWRSAPDCQTDPPSLAAAPDLPGTDGGPQHRTTLGLVLTGHARAATQPTRMACVLASLRNEGPYLLPWIAYHRAIGFDGIVLYSNDNDDGSDALLERLAACGIVTWFRNELRPESLPQHRAYGHALSAWPGLLAYRWTLIADIDEYFGFDTKRFSGVADYLNFQQYRYADAIALPWKLHVARPGDVWDDRPCIARFPLREAAVNAHVKCLFRSNLCWNANPHYPEPVHGRALAYRDDAGEPYAHQATPALAAQPKGSHGWIAHYMCRSLPEFLMKLARGRGDQPRELRGLSTENRLRTCLRQITSTDLVNDQGMLACASGQAAELARLLALPGIAACDAAIKAVYRERMHAACRAFLEGASANPLAPSSLFRVLLRETAEASAA